MEKRIIQVEEKVPVKLVDTIKYPAHVCHVWRIRSGAFPVWHQPGYCAVYEWYRDPFIYCYYKGKSTGLLRF